VKLTEQEALALLAAHDHGILCTLHPERGIDAVPVVYVNDAHGYVGIPVDLVKPKSSLRLQRERNLEADDRATLLIEHWDRDDWSKLWWVRAELRKQSDISDHDQKNQHTGQDDQSSHDSKEIQHNQHSQHGQDDHGPGGLQAREASLADELSRRYPQYQIDQPFAKVIVLRIVSVTGWAATADDTPKP
jgi:Pyridoxamine 5'-phosphate oxidase